MSTPKGDISDGPAFPCELCGSATHRRARLRREASKGILAGLHRCEGCGLIFAWPQPSPEQVEDMYDGNYYVFHEPPGKRWARSVQVYANYLRPLEDRLPRRRLLEVGSARGHLLALARERGWDVHGVEIGQEAVRNAREEFDLQVTHGTLEDQDGALGQYDVIIAIDVIEHVPQPARFVRAIRRHLCAGGVAIVETPNWQSPWRRLGGARWIGLNPFHILLYDASSLTRLLQAAGFTRCRTHSTTNTAHSLWGCRPEVVGLTRRLPGALQWRVERWLNRVTPKSWTTSLRMRPPETLAEAVSLLEHNDFEPQLERPSRADNLVIIAKT